MHLIQHLFDDIEAKGVTRNYTSKTFETMHGSMGATYLRMTNFKDVGRQVIITVIVASFAWSNTTNL